MNSFWLQISATVIGAIIAAYAVDRMRGQMDAVQHKREEKLNAY